MLQRFRKPPFVISIFVNILIHQKINPFCTLIIASFIFRVYKWIPDHYAIQRLLVNCQATEMYLRQNSCLEQVNRTG